ncbi:MAG: lipid kinase YegS [Luteimonas sp.]
MAERETRTRAPRWRMILNGKSAQNDSLRAAVLAMRERGVALEVRVTWENADVGRYVDEAVDHAIDVLIAAGGDGTLSGVATALALRTEDADQLPSLALVPLGTANDFAAAAEIPEEPLAALDLAWSCPARPIDVLKIQAGTSTRYCANLVSGGFGAQGTAGTRDGLKKAFGGLAYFLTGIAKLARIEPIQARIAGRDADGNAFEWNERFIVLGIGNGRQAGGGHALCPEALIDDGLLDLTIVPPLEGEVGTAIAALIGDGAHAALECVTERRRLTSMSITSLQPLTLNVDGEPVEAHDFRVDCIAHRVRMHLPADCPLLRR